MSDRIAKEDIIRKNEAGQRVVVVPKGQPIPEGFEDEAGEAAPTPKAKTEDKARRSSKGA